MRLPLLSGPLLAAVAFSALTASAAPEAANAPPITSYYIDNHGQQITVRGESGNTLLTRRIATPQLALVIDVPSRTNAGTLTLRDTGGTAYWSAPIPSDRSTFIGGAWSGSTFRDGHWITPSDESGIRLERGKDESAGAGDDAKTKRLTVLINAADTFGKTRIDTDQGPVQMTVGKGGISAQTPDGSMSSRLTPDSTGAGQGMLLTLNGKQIPITRVKRDGKNYLAFPWNGHQVSVQSGCTFRFDSAGNLTIDAPAAPVKK